MPCSETYRLLSGSDVESPAVRRYTSIYPFMAVTNHQMIGEMSKPLIRAAVLTISDSASRGEREDQSGPVVVAELQSLKAEIVATEVLPDEREQIAARLRHYADSGTVNLIVTTGGTGLSPRDVTPEATRDV